MLKVLQPDMPSAAEMLPYLKQMDERREYVNGGAFVCELERAVESLGGVPAVAVANGTVAIEEALRSLRLPPDSLVLVPAVTFSATGLAVMRAGLRPLIVDVDQDTWQLTPETAEKWYMSGISDTAPWRRIRAVVPVAAFGSPVNAAEWEAFSDRYCIPVVIDAAGCLLTQKLPMSRLMTTCYSLHATKFIGAGEGGIVRTDNAERAQLIRDRIAFGAHGTNAKLSEIHAAYALASLAYGRMTRKRNTSESLQRIYARWMPKALGLCLPPATADRAILPVLMPSLDVALEVTRRMDAASIETKRWYAPFLHRRPDTMPYAGKGERFEVAEMLSERLIGLPFHSFMSEADAQRVCSIVRGAL